MVGLELSKNRSCENLVGVDLSEQMLKVASSKRLYSELKCSDILEFLGSDGRTWDLIVASDVFNYFGNLANVFTGCATRLKPYGMLAFTIENGECSVSTQHNGRFKHSIGYIKDTLHAAGLRTTKIASFPARNEGGKVVEGTAILAERIKDFPNN